MRLQKLGNIEPIYVSLAKFQLNFHTIDEFADRFCKQLIEATRLHRKDIELIDI